MAQEDKIVVRHRLFVCPPGCVVLWVPGLLMNANLCLFGLLGMLGRVRHLFAPSLDRLDLPYVPNTKGEKYPCMAFWKF